MDDGYGPVTSLVDAAAARAQACFAPDRAPVRPVLDELAGALRETALAGLAHGPVCLWCDTLMGRPVTDWIRL